MKTLLYIEEDSAGRITGALVDDGGKETRIPVPEPFPRSELAARARGLASAFGIALPDNPAIPPANPPTP